MDCHYFNLTVTNFKIYYTFVLILKMVVIETFSEINYQEPEILEKNKLVSPKCRLHQKSGSKNCLRKKGVYYYPIPKKTKFSFRKRKLVVRNYLLRITSKHIEPLRTS